MNQEETNILNRTSAPLEELFELDFALMGKLFKTNFRKILAISLSMLGVLSLGILFFPEKYTAQTTLFLNLSDIPGVVKQTEGVNVLKASALGGGPDPFKNQEELLKNPYLLTHVLTALQPLNHAYHLHFRETKNLKRVLNEEHPSDTVFIKLYATWSDPKIAEKILNVYLKAYQELSETLNMQPLVERRQSLEKELLMAENKLLSTTRKFQGYEESQKVIDLEEESKLLLEQLDHFEEQYNADQASMVSLNTQSQQIQSQLHLDPQSALNAVAIASGPENSYQHLLDELRTSEREYQMNALIYTDKTPSIQQSKEKIKVLKKQIHEYETLSIGHPLPPHKIVIGDEVRTEMVKQLATIETQAKGIADKQKVTQAQIQNLELQLNTIPQKQSSNGQFTMERQHWLNVVTQLRTSLADIEIQALYKKLFILAPPAVAEHPDFPNRRHLFGFAILLSFLLPTGLILIPRYREYVQPSYLENAFGIPVLSSMVSNGIRKPENDAAYYTAAFKLKRLRQQMQNNTFSFAPITENHSATVLNLAKVLAKGNERVLLIDACLRFAPLSNLLAGQQQDRSGLSDLMKSFLSSSTLLTEPSSSVILTHAEPYILKTHNHDNLYILPAGQCLAQPFETLSHPILSEIILSLSETFDWVLINLPSLSSESPDYVVLLPLSAAIIVTLDTLTSKQQVRKAISKVEQVDQSVSGALYTVLS
jgi:Mrp family chromosome partitioning ATPase/uncharacterized protein involved in exopolysaccharide biosynthesis